MDPFFNQEYADEVYEYVAGMDDDTAQMFTLMVAHDVLHQHVDDNRQVVKSYTNEILTDIADTVISKALDRGDEDVAELVSKATERWTIDGRPVTVKRARDAGGRFSRVDTRNYKMSVKTKKDGSRVLRTKYTGPDDNWAMQSGKQYDVTAALMNKPGERASQFEQEWNARQDERGSTSRTYNRIGAGSKLVSEVGLATGNTKMATAGKMGEFAGSFGPEAEKVVGPSMRKTAYRYRGTEKKVDPKVKKLAAQYQQMAMRDQPDAPQALSSAQKRALDQKAAKLFREREDKSQTMTDVKRSVYQQYRGANMRDQAPLTPEARQEAARTAAVGFLREKLPDSGLSSLHTASGKIPPSEGLLIDADGEIVAQAVGYMEDHYLPFNLKNLKSLQGGTYVRTRSSGGPTSEDIYTGLMAGARSVTVVSRSGTYTIDFEDDFRGVRRYGDVARGMVDRYEKTLDAVQSKTIERVPISAMDKARIRAEVEEQYEGLRHTKEGITFIEKEVAAAIEEEKRSTELSLRDWEKINERVEIEMKKPIGNLPADDAVRERIIRSNLAEHAKQEKENRMLQLDGQGYETALKALKEQYPYFIANVRPHVYEDADNKKPFSRETDQGYVRPNYLRPKAVKEGYFDSDIEGIDGMTIDGKQTGKYSAAETNYQNYANRRQMSPRRIDSEDEPDNKPERPTASRPGERPDNPKPGDNKPSDREAYVGMAEMLLQYSKPGAMRDIREMAGGEPPSSDEGKRNLNRAMRDPKNREQVLSIFTAEIDKNGEALDAEDFDKAQQLIAQAKTTSSGGKWTMGMSSPKEPAKFDEVPEGKKPKFYEALIRSFENADSMRVDNDGTLRDMADTSRELAKIYDRGAKGELDTEGSDVEMVQELAAEDAFLSENEKEVNAFRRSRTSPAAMQMMADRHKRRNKEIEMQRTALKHWREAYQKETGKDPFYEGITPWSKQ